MASFTTAQKNALQDAIDYLTKGTAVELPFDAQLAERLALVAVSTGFVASTGTFVQQVRDNPLSTLIAFVKFAGS